MEKKKCEQKNVEGKSRRLRTYHYLNTHFQELAKNIEKGAREIEEQDITEERGINVQQKSRMHKNTLMHGFIRSFTSCKTYLKLSYLIKESK